MTDGITLSKKELAYIESVLSHEVDRIQSVESNDDEYNDFISDLKFLLKKFQNRNNKFVNQLYADTKGNLYITELLAYEGFEPMVVFHSLSNEEDRHFLKINKFLKHFSLVEQSFDNQLFKDLEGNIYVTLYLSENLSDGSSMVLYYQEENKQRILCMKKEQFLEKYTFYKPNQLTK